MRARARVRGRVRVRARGRVRGRGMVRVRGMRRELLDAAERLDHLHLPQRERLDVVLDDRLEQG